MERFEGLQTASGIDSIDESINQGNTVSTVIFLSGTTAADVLRGLGRSLGSVLEQRGLDVVEIALDRPNCMETLTETVNLSDVEFAFAFLGMGANIQAECNDGVKRNLWEIMGVPLISLCGDSPAYFFDRHVHPSRYVGTLYGFPEHYEFRKRLPHCDGLLGLSGSFAYDIVEASSIDFKRKIQGKLFFPKNGNDPKKLLGMWKETLRPGTAAMLFELARELESKIDTPASDDIDGVVCAYFKSRNLDIDGLMRLRLFFVAQLDDYLRRIKSTMMAEVLMDFPVEIHGYNWDHLDFSGKRCTFVSGGSYNQSREVIKNALGVVDMSPNTSLAPHDRPLRAFGMHTLCLTNEQAYFQNAFPSHREFSFRFTKESLREKVAEVLSRPSYFVELGIEVSEQFRRENPPDKVVDTMIEAANLIRADRAQNFGGMQPFFIWPPTKLA